MMSDTTTTAPAPPTPEELQEMRMEQARHNMAGSPLGTVPSAEPEGEAPPSPIEDADATKLGQEIAQRYVPPPPPPTVLELLDEMKKPKSE
jgi:hypothetical protein